MAFKTTQSREIPATQFTRALQIALQVKRSADAFRTKALAGSVSVSDLEIGFLYVLTEARAALATAAATPGIAAYAKEQFDASYEIGPAFTAMTTEIETMLNWLEINFPQSGGGHLQSRRFVGDGLGTTEAAAITIPSQLNALVTRLDALIATID